MEQINSREYWNNRFKTNDWNDHMGMEQTKYFAQLACRLMPDWFVKDVCRNEYTICDLGCAEGDSIPILQSTFPTAKIVGEDFSDEAIIRAGKKYEEYFFKVSNMLQPEKEDIYPVIFSSNTIEHFRNTHQVLKMLEKRTSNYLVLLIPFREDFEIEEHEVTLDTNMIPCKLEDSFLVYARSIYCNSEYYGKEQLLLIYSKDKSIIKASFLSDLTENLVNENNKRLQTEYQELKNDWQRLNDNLYLSNEQIKDLESQNKSLENQNLDLNEESVDLKNLIKKVQGDKEADSQEMKDRLSKNKNYILESYNYITEARNANSYKKLLYLRRIKEQLFHGDKLAKKDFIKYSLNKLLRKTKYNCNSLYKFDKLSIAQTNLEEMLNNISDNNQSINYLNTESNCKNTRQIYLFCGVPYYDIGGGQRCSQLANTFNKMGYDVYYYYAFDSSESVKYDLTMPAIQHEHIDNIQVHNIFENIKEEAIFIFEAPYFKFVPYLEKAKQLNVKTIYEHIDNWETSLGSLLYNKASFDIFIQLSDILVATSLELVKQIQKHTNKEIAYLPNAVNITMFESEYFYQQPKDLKIGRKKTLIYFGSLWGEWFDWDIIKNTAINCPDSTFNMIGDYSGIPQIVKSMPSNVHFLGLKKQQELPAYLKFSNIALLPFKNCEIGKYVSPLKIFEYIAMKKMVLATPLPDIINYPNTICTEDYKIWVKYINDNDTEVVNPDEFISENSWYNRCNSLLNLGELDFIGQEEIKQKKISIIVLNYNNKSVIFRCIDSLLKHKNRYEYQIVVVDNNSTDGSFELLQKKYSGLITLVKNEVNGCSSGRNLGVKNAHGEIFVFLDSDQWVICDRWLDSALYILKGYKGIGALSWGAGWFNEGLLTGPIVDYYPNRAVKSNQLFRDNISYLATSGFVIKRDIFNKTDGFDEKYDPTCYEDTDLSFQVRDLGLKTVYCPYMGIMHLPHQTTNSGTTKHSDLMERNGNYFLNKWHNKNERLLLEAWSRKAF